MAEYTRYYALYPFGAALHVFMSEFTDHKDSGPVILSHFYLLTGCAGTLWLEPTQGGIAHQIGVLTLGVGDALASIIGRRYGRVRWPGSSKTVEGSIAFVTSIFASACLLRLIGWCDAFNVSFDPSFICLSAKADPCCAPAFALLPRHSDTRHFGRRRFTERQSRLAHLRLYLHLSL